MALIDIAKLNAEVDKLIEKQDEEIKRINTEVELKKETRFRAFMNEMEKYSEIVEPIQPAPYIFVGKHENGYGCRHPYYLRFDKRYHNIIISFGHDGKEYSQRFGYHQPFKEATAFGGSEVINSITKWYFEHSDEFELNLTKACIDVIRDKAKAANEKMETAEKTRSFES